VLPRQPEDHRQDHDHDFDWTGEQWGSHGRPVFILNGPSHSRTAWWPVAARLADAHAVTILELPERRSPHSLAEDLALHLAQQGSRAPVLIGHASSALVAALFALRFVAHAVVAVERSLDTRPAAAAAEDLGTLELLRELTGGTTAIRCPFLSVLAAEPGPGYPAWLRERIPSSRCEVYGTAGPYPHLEHGARFVADVREVAA
jgi:pimeloyl-ACP methyl ester carboxylesterase